MMFILSFLIALILGPPPPPSLVDPCEGPEIYQMCDPNACPPGVEDCHY